MKKLIEKMFGVKVIAASNNIKGRKTTGVHDQGSGTKGFEKDNSHSSVSYN
jgi:hypothetical protein